MVALNPYELLGVRPSSTTAEIAAAYEQLFEVFDPRRWAGSPVLSREAAAWAEAIDRARRTILEPRQGASIGSQASTDCAVRPTTTRAHALPPMSNGSARP